MTKTRSTKSALISSVLALFLCFTMLLGTTFAWFTDSVTSAGNKIMSGSLIVDLELLDKDGNWNSTKANKDPIFNYDKWEPGYTDVKILKIENEGTLALKWKAKFISGNELSALADVIDVYVYPSATELTYPADRDLTGYTKVGTVAEFVNTIETTTTGNLEAGEAAYLGIALKMQESANNDYQGLDLGGAFDIMILATQLDSESDSFDDQYDKGATLDFYPVASFEDLKLALANKVESITLTGDIQATEALMIDYTANINGAGFTISRANGYTGTMMTAGANSTLTLENIVLDGSGATATGNLIRTTGNGNIVLNEGTVLQNNNGAHAVYLDHGSKQGSLTLNGAQIINNSSDSGAIWGGGAIIVNDGSKINNNSSTGSAGAIRMVSACNLTMNGGEISGNTAAGDGGAIWGYGSSNYTFNGGEMSNNTSNGVGGAIYLGTYSPVYVSGDFKMCNNTAKSSGAVRFTDHTSLYMSGGEISGNISKDNADYNGFYGWDTYVELTGGELTDDITISSGLTPTVGGGNGTGVIHFDVHTNHNTVNLVKDFSTFKFTVNEGRDNFAAFNFKPAAGYTYAEGDEAKLICMNEGYETYWDASTGTFRLQAKQ